MNSKNSSAMTCKGMQGRQNLQPYSFVILSNWSNAWRILQTICQLSESAGKNIK